MSTVAGGVSTFTPFTLGQATGAIINGTEFLRPFGLQAESPGLAGTLRFDAPIVVVPASEGAAAFGVDLTVPFVFSGDVTGFARHDVDARVPLFQISLVGQGTANLSLANFGGLFQEPQLTYTFAATPEPASLMLLGTGFVGLVARSWNRKKCDV